MSSSSPSSSVELDWRVPLAKATNLPTKVFCTMSNGEVVRKLFEGCISPGIEVANDGIKLDIPDKFNIKIHGCIKFYKLLHDKALFNTLPQYIQKSTLDILCFTLRRSVHDVARFRYCEHKHKSGIVDILLNLLSDVVLMDKMTLQREDMLIAKRVIRLLGVVAVCGMSIPELKKFLSLLRLPSIFSISLLQALKSTLVVNDTIVKAYPLSFFDFCDCKAGLSITPFSFPFTKEYQISFWFRVDSYPKKTDETENKQYLFTYMNNNNGLMIYLEDDLLCVSVSNGPSETTLIKCSDNNISEGVWYHFCVTHNKPRMTLFASYQMSISLDGKQCFQHIVRFPSAATIDNMTNASIGKGFDGQIGTVYVFNEVISSSAMDAIASRDSGKPSKDSLKKSVAPKVLSVYHPQRCDGRLVVEHHGGHHATLGDDTHVSNIVPVRDTLTSLGGVACLLPLFPTLLVEHEELRADLYTQSAGCPMPVGWEAVVGQDTQEVQRKSSSNGYTATNVGLGTALYEIMTDDDLPLMFGVQTIEKLDTYDIFELQDDKPIGLLLFIMARCMRQHMTHQMTFMNVGGVQMISYCLKRIPSDSRILKEEDESCILALLQLRDSVKTYPELEVLVMRELICNISIWSAASYKLQTSLYSMILANIKAQTDFFLDVFGVQSVIDYLDEFYLHAVDKPVNESNTLVYVSTSPSDSGGGIVQKVGEVVSTPPPPSPGTPSSVPTLCTLPDRKPTGIRKEKSKSLSGVSLTMFDQIREGDNVDEKKTLGTEEDAGASMTSSRRSSDSLRKIEEDDSSSSSSATENIHVLADSSSNNNTPQQTSMSKPRRRGSGGSNSFLRSVNRRMSATEVPISTLMSPDKSLVSPQDKQRQDTSRLAEHGRSMSVKFSETSTPTPIPAKYRKSFSFGTMSMSGDGMDDGDMEDAEDSDDDSREHSATKLNSEERKSIRSILQSMIIVLSMHRSGVQEIEPLFFFLQNCEDNIVLDEIVQLLLCIVVGDHSMRIVTTMMELFKGPEDFLSFVLNRLDHRPYEPLRCTCFALLIHFYLRIDSLPSSLTNSSASKIKKGSRLHKSREKYSSVGDDGLALQRLDACGGLASICMLLNASKKDCGKDTYTSLFSLLFVNRASNRHITPFFKQLFKECVSQSPSAGSGECHIDESQEILNPTLLVSYFYFVPKLPRSVQESVHCDLLAILKHNPENREFFRDNISWHLCMYDLVGQLVVGKEGGSTIFLHGSEVTGFLREWAFFQRPHKEDAISHLFMGQSCGSPRDFSGSPSLQKSFSGGRKSLLGGEGKPKNSPTSSSSPSSMDANMLEMWFDIGMKTYATMLVHSMDMMGGFVEIQRTASQSYESAQGIAVTLSIFSHLLHELTFTIQSKYKDMQRMARSTNSDDVVEATNKLENMLSIIILLSLYLFEKDSIAILGVPNIALARKRFSILKKVRMNQSSKTACQSSCTEETHADLCSVAVDTCNLCGHSLSLHILDKKSTMDLVEEQLLADIASGNVDDDSLGAGIGASAGEETTKVPMSMSMCVDVEMEVEVGMHQWMDLRSGVGYPPEVKPSLHRRHSSGRGKNLFTEETLNPLERGYEMARGKMVVSLQVLRYFDMIFWPEENRLRNNHLMNFDIPSKGSTRKSPRATVSSPMTMYSSVLRTSLFVFHGLSPFTEFAEQNVRRLEQLVKIIEQVPKTCPTNEWTLVILAHLMLALQRIYSSIESLYSMLGIDSYFSAPSTAAPNLSSSSDDDVFSDHAVTEKINNLFNHPAGKQLVQFINSCITLLVTIYSTRKEFLSSRLDDKTFLSFTLLIQNTQNYQFHVPSVKEKFTFTKSSSDKFKDARKKSNERNSSSDELEDSGDTYRSSSPKSSRHSPFRTQNGGNSAKGRQFSTSNFSTDGADQECDEKICEDALYALCFLRDPFLQLEVDKNGSMLEAFFALESFEGHCSAAHLKEMVKLQDELMVKRNLIGNYMDEIDELTELGQEVKQSILQKDSTRKTNKSVRMEISTKASATFWNNCLRMFEESWSPWSSEHDGGEPCNHYTASVHRDTSMRRMVMFRNDEHIDYSDAAYFEGKLRDQQDFDDGVGLTPNEDDADNNTSEVALAKGSSASANPTSTLSFMKDTLQLTRPKASKLSTSDDVTGDNSDNDNDSLEDAEETTIDVKRNENNIFSSVLNNSVEKRPLWALTFSWHSDEHEIFSAEVMEIMTEQVLSGTVLLTNRNIYFHPKKRTGGFLVKPDEFRNKRWRLSKMTECYGRRYLLQNCGIELFFSDSPELFFAFNTHKDSQRFFRHLKKQPLPSLVTTLSLSPSTIFQQSSWTELWKKRAISNFEYIMRLNIIAGRSYNDITQYPVFPWVLNDYESETLDLDDPNIYRDLSKPVGALNPERLEEILDRYKSFGEMDMPQFMYGSHYSSAGLILHFMIRQEPFTSMAITLQGGRFDCPDRLFFNIKETWKCCNTSMSDVKELVPQMFYFPEAFSNTNSLPLGEMQDDRGEVGEVVLPPWCNNDPFEFVRIHRAALESEYVSEHLHEWIDLIFGFKQTGPAAVEANNVFHYLTYENAIDIEAITDPLQRAAAKAQVTHFGQTPSQITSKEHPKRNPVEDCITSFCAFPTAECLDRFQCYLHPKQCGLNGEHGAVVAFNCSSSQLIVCYADFTIAYHKWSTVPETNKTPFSLKFDKSRVLPKANSSTFYHHIPTKSGEDEVEKPSPIRSRASSVGEGLLAAGSSLFKRSSGLFAQDDLVKKSTSSEEPNNSNSNIASSALSENDIKLVEDDNEDEDDDIDEDVESPQSPSSTDSSGAARTMEGVSHTPFSESNTNTTDDSSSIDSSVRDSRPSLDETPVISEKFSNKHVSIKMGEGSSGFIISCGYWNNAMKIHSLKDSLNEVMSTSGGHTGQITCLALGRHQDTLVTGGQDGTCRVWHIHGSMELSLDLKHVLLGHANPVTAVAYSSHHDLVLSASTNGHLCLHTAQRGLFVRAVTTLCAENSHPVDQLGISNAGYLITHSSGDLSLNVFWINGQHLKRIVLESSVECMIFNREGSVLFCGMANGEVAVLRTWDLERICSIDLPEYGSITCLKLVADDQYLLIGSEKGSFHIGTDPETRWKILHSVISMNPLISSTL